jgi:hypothetical protein
VYVGVVEGHQQIKDERQPDEHVEQEGRDDGVLRREEGKKRWMQEVPAMVARGCARTCSGTTRSTKEWPPASEAD